MENVTQVTPNVFTHTKLRGSNPSFVVTSGGVVAIDTPQLPSRAVEWRALTESHGPIRYLINTENHVDHIFGNYYYRGSGAIVVNHQGLYERFMVPGPEIDPFDYAHEAVPADDPSHVRLGDRQREDDLVAGLFNLHADRVAARRSDGVPRVAVGRTPRRRKLAAPARSAGVPLPLKK